MAVTISDIVNFTGNDSEFNPYPQMDERYGPYDSVSAALTALTTSKRCVGLTIGIKSGNSITEYWFKDGVSDSNLVEKADSAYQNYKSNGGDKTKDDFYSTLTKIVGTSTYVILHANVDSVKVEVNLSDGEVVEIGSSSTTSTTSTTTSTQPPVKTSTVVFEHDPKTAYTITYNEGSKLTVSDLEDGKIKLTFPAGVTSLQFTINSIVCDNSNYECKEVRQDILTHSLPYSTNVSANQYITITPVITDSEPTTTTTTSSTTSTQPPGQLAYLQLDTKDLDMSLPEDSRTVNVKVSNGGGSTSFVLNGDTIHHSYSGLGGTIGSKVTLSLPLSTYEQVVGFYDSKTGELLSNEQEYKFDTPSDGMSYITIKFKGSDSTNH